MLSYKSNRSRWSVRSHYLGLLCGCLPWPLAGQDSTGSSDSRLNEVPAVVVVAQLPSYGPIDLPPVSCQMTRDKHLGRVSYIFGPLCDEVDALVACRALHSDRLALNGTELVRVLVGKVVGLRTEDAAFPFDEETRAVPNTRPLQLCRHGRF